jgi:hypothetical protein
MAWECNGQSLDDTCFEMAWDLAVGHRPISSSLLCLRLGILAADGAASTDCIIAT